ncbi:hypothetical protein EON65_58095 [archaeon]|nr:MAG: hypothetical protein EON65_58095 [archaeon]
MSTSHVKALEVTVLETIAGSAQGHPCHHSNVLFHNRLDAAHITGSSPVKQQSDYQVVANQLSLSQVQKLTVPVSASRPSYIGQLGLVTHKLCITVCTSLGLTIQSLISH